VLRHQMWIISEPSNICIRVPVFVAKLSILAPLLPGD
jgi:hypothetical protein